MTISVRIFATIVLCTGLAACSGTSGSKPDAKTITCADYAKLDETARVDVVNQLSPKPTADTGSSEAKQMEPMVTQLCKSVPDSKVADLIGTSTPTSHNPPPTP
jgi:hypothetical protein